MMWRKVLFVAAAATVAAMLSAVVVNGDDSLLKDRLAMLFANPVSLSVRTLRKDLKWTDDKDLTKYLPDVGGNDKDVKAFRDLFVENLIKKLFVRGMKNAKRSARFGNSFPQDPLSVVKGIHFTKKEEMFAIDMTANRMQVRGLTQMALDYIRVVRHFGLQDVKVSLRVKTNLKITGNYVLDGTAIGFLPVTGDGQFEIDGQDVEVSIITYAVSTAGKDDEVARTTVKEADAQLSYKNVQFKFDNLMGGGVVGSAANVVINAMGEAIIETQKQELIDYIREKYHGIVEQYL